LRLAERCYGPAAVTRLLNLIRCQSHREVLQTICEQWHREAHGSPRQDN
jgi:hypothetical protein